MLGLVLAACTPAPVTPAPEQLVIEGWIEDGAAPVVYVSTTMRVVEGQEMNQETVQEHIVKWGKVAISDGTEEVILTGTASSRFYPPYAYTTGRMLGKVGKTYTIKVEYDSAVATAQATIPAPVAMESVEAVQIENSQEYAARIRFKDDPSTEDYYRFFVRIKDVDKTYLPAHLGTVSDLQAAGGNIQIDIQPGGSMIRESRSGFRSGEVVDIKLCTMNYPMYQYWNAFEEQYALASLPFFSLDTNLPGNVTGGIGYFAAYGSTTATLTIP